MSATLTINGQTYQRWTRAKIVRGLKNAAAGFEFDIPGELDVPILPGAGCAVDESGDLIVTGYVDSVHITIAARSTVARVSGRSKTEDLVDCMPQHTTNQFNGYTLDAIAKALAQQFGIDAILGPGVDVGDAFPDATFQLNETAYNFLERLARQRGVLLTDDEHGNLVLATLGTAAAPAALVQGMGGNVFEANGTLSWAKRYSQYTIYSQAGKKQTGGPVEPAVKQIAYDGGVTRYRPWAGIAESAVTNADALLRAQWEASHRAGESVFARLTVPEWRAAGQLWQVNQLAQCTVPRLTLDQQYLIGGIEFTEDDKGRRTILTVAPSSAFQPGIVKVKNAGTGNQGWDGISNVVSPPKAAA